MIKYILLISVLFLTSCSSDVTNEKDNIQSTTKDSKSNNQNLGTIVSEETGETFNENDGSQIPNNLNINDINIFMLNNNCQNEVLPEIVNRISFDYDGDTYMDAGIVTKCTEEDNYSVTVFRATSRGWWNKFTVDSTMKDIKITGGCEANASKLICSAIRDNKVSNEVSEGYFFLYYNTEGFNMFFNQELIFDEELANRD